MRRFAVLVAVLILMAYALSNRRKPKAWGRWEEPDDGWELFV